MSDGGIGRLLVASLHQGIADLLPDRLEFYEAWFNPAGLRDGRIGLASLAAVLSFLRQEGASYHLVAARAGEYAAEWTVAGLPVTTRAGLRLALRLAPARARVQLAMRLVKRLVRRTYGGSRALVQRRAGGRAIDLRASLFCEVRGRVDDPLCGFYASAVHRLLQLCRVEAEVTVDACRAVGAGHCVLSVVTRHGSTGRRPRQPVAQVPEGERAGHDTPGDESV